MTNLVLSDIEHQLNIRKTCREREATLNQFKESNTR